MPNPSTEGGSGAGTEVLRRGYVHAMTNSSTTLLAGVANHIYTVLSIVCMATTVQNDGNWVDVYFDAFDSKGAASGADIKIFRQAMNGQETFVWNDKFSFNGCEPTGFSGALSTVAEQDALADQGSSTSQILWVATQHADDDMDVTITYIDQNNE